MTIERVSSGIPYRQQVEKLEGNDFEINGKVNQAKFQEFKIDDFLYDFGVGNKYTGSKLGNTLSDYHNWVHFKSKTGYSIWRYPLTDYVHNTDNELYLDDIVLDLRGEATSESLTSFDKVFVYDGATYTDQTTEAGTEVGTAFTVLEGTDDFLYVGASAAFSGIAFDFDTKGANITLVLQYYNGSTWVTLATTTDSLDDNTSNTKSDGLITYTSPTLWAQTAVNGSTYYWIRFSTSTAPVTAPTIYSITPYDNIDSLLQLSSTQITNEDWSWGYYYDSTQGTTGANLYVSVRNDGDSDYDGDFYIKSSSSALNKQNFFIYNHNYLLNQQVSYYDKGKMDVVNTGASIMFNLQHRPNSADNTVMLCLDTINTGSGNGYPLQFKGEAIDEVSGGDTKAGRIAVLDKDGNERYLYLYSD